MKNTKHDMVFSCLLCIFIGAFILSFSSQSMAATFCVADETDLLNALAQANSNSENDIIKIQQGTYFGNFVYASTESFSVTIEGGHSDAFCTLRDVDPANTVLDGNENGVVLALSANVAVDFAVDGMTLQNGSVTGNGGGAFLQTDKGTLMLSNNIIKNNSIVGTGNRGGAYIYGNETVTLINNTIEDNTTGGHGGGAVIWNVDYVTMTDNTLAGNQSANTAGGIFIDIDSLRKPKMIKLMSNIIDNNIANSLGGFYIKGDNAIITISDNVISNNEAQSAGGGQIVGGGSSGVVLFTDNSVSYNVAQTSDIGGVAISGDQQVEVRNNIINNNTSLQYFGGLRITGTESVSVINNIVFNNSSANAAGLYIDFPGNYENGIITATNNTIVKNTASTNGGGVYITLDQDSQSARIYNNIILYNSAFEGSDLYIRNDSNNNFLPSTVNLYNNDFDQSSDGTYIQIPFPIDPSNLDNEDPLFVDSLNDDYHLTEDSPCIDMGNNSAPELPLKDKDGKPRIIDGDKDLMAKVDIGAYEYGIPKGDLDGDGDIDGDDLRIFAEIYGTYVGP